MEFWFFDRDDRLLFIRNDAESAVHTEETMRLQASFPEDPEKPIQAGMRIAFHDIDNMFQCFEIRKPTHKQPDNIVSIDAEHIAIAELMDAVIEDKRPTATNAALALATALENTEWRVGKVEESPQLSTTFYYLPVWKAILKIREVWNMELAPRIEIDAHGITSRYIDVLTRRGQDRGVRIELDHNLENASVIWDDSGLFTALYGRGKGVQVGEREDGTETYGRKLTFEDVCWSIENGDPADKPEGQKWVEDTAASALWGRNGRRRFGVVDFDDIEDPEELLRLTWEELQRVKIPKFTMNATVVDMRALGYAGQPMRLGDDVAVIIQPINVRVKASIVKLQRDLLAPDKTRHTIGNWETDMLSVNLGIERAAKAGQQVAKQNPSLLEGFIDTMVTRIMSSGTKRDTYKDGGEIYISADGQSAVLITGGGILLASEKVDGEWNWRTAIDGNSVNADEIRAGTLQASLIKILGSELFYWMADNLYLISPQDSLKQIRIGMYDGENMGIGYTEDGGITWNTAIGFDGAHFGDSIGGFDIKSNGLTNGGLIQLMSDGRIILGGIEMDGGDHPYFSFEYSGMRAFYIGEGACSVDQIFYANGPFYARGPVYFDALPTTSNPPNLYIESSGRLYRSTWTPSVGGGGTDPGGGGTGDNGIDIQIGWNKYSVTAGETITATVYVNSGSPTSYKYTLYINGAAQTSVTTSSRTYSVSTLLAGNYIMEVEASGNGGFGYASSSPCVVTSGGGTGGGIYPRAAQTIGSNVRIRSTPTTDSSTNILYTIPAAGTNITVTDPYVNGSDGFAWWPVTYQSYRGYIRSDFVLILVS